MKAYVIYVALCSLAQGVYISRMAPMNRMTTINRIRAPAAFRPGINLQLQGMQRPWNYGTMRLAQAASHRAPYVLYRNAPQRYAIKHYTSGNRNMFTHGPWKTTARLPPMSAVTPEYEFVKAASAPSVVHNDAPNLSLSEKPIVVIDASENPVSEQAKPSYEVTEKYPEGEYSVAKIEAPVGFSKATSFSTPELQALIRNGAALQLASEYSLPVSVSHHQILPQQFQMQSVSNLPSHQELVNTGAEGILIPPNALYQSDPMFLQKLQSQLIQRYPAVEFIPYAADSSNQVNQVHIQPQPQASQHHPQIVLLENEQLNKPLTIRIPEQSQKNVVQRETQEASVVTLIPQSFVAPNTTERQETTTTPRPQNITVELVAAESQPVSTTIKYVIEANTEEQNTTPIYYAQIGQSVGSVIANGFYTAINDVRAAAAMAQVEKTTEQATEKPTDNITTTTTTLIPDLKAYFVKSDEKSENTSTGELKSLLGVPFKKATDSVNVAYTLVRSDDKQPKVTQEGAVYAGQIVEATISEDQDFNKEKATLISRRAPIRLFAVPDAKNTAAATNTLSMPKVVVKAKIPAKSKLIYDDKTGEPILRIYASYVDSNSQKEAIVSKLAALKPKDSVIKRDLAETWKTATVKSVDKNQGFDANQVTEFGLKLRERSDDYIPLFEEYDD